MSNEARNSNGVRARQFSGVQKKPRKPAAPKVGKGDGKRRKAELRVVTPSHGHPGQQTVGVTFVPDLISIRPTDTAETGQFAFRPPLPIELLIDLTRC